MELLRHLKGSLETIKRFKNLVIFFASTTIVFFILGQLMMAENIPWLVEYREEALREIEKLPYLKPLRGVLAGSLVLKILYTFFFNLIFGAFVSTTLAGIIFFLPYLVTVMRSFLIGALFYGKDASLIGGVIFYGTFILEFGAYTLSAVAGTDIGFSLISPSWKGKETRGEALGTSLKDAVSIYFAVIIILFLGAVWEMSWLHYTSPINLPDTG